MKTFNNGILTICLVLSMAIGAGSIKAMDADEIPSPLTLDRLQKLYEPVSFDHQMHAESFGCNACHHHTTGDGSQDSSCMRCHADSAAAAEVSCSACHAQDLTAKAPATADKGTISYHIDKPSLLGALHLQCLGCHRAESGPTGCQDCHAMTDAGKKRFALQD